ncbi:MAG: hypothetical protein GF364_00325 [Candidatus Lokiarchaeota archaeon]|nr:hypothetical protein [Candidatus Lokiarchaeota archaeon]
MNSDIEKLFDTTNTYVFLAGAGISIPPPSNIPSARDIMQYIIKNTVMEDEVEKVLKIKELR